MSFLKGCVKVVGSVALGATGVASTLLRTGLSAAGMDELADAVGTIQDGSFNKIQDMWTPDEQKTEEYYEKQADRMMSRAESAARMGEEQRRKYEKMKEQAGKK